MCSNLIYRYETLTNKPHQPYWNWYCWHWVPQPFYLQGKKIIFILVFMHSCKTIPNTIKHDSGRKNIIKLKNIQNDSIHSTKSCSN